MIRKQYIKLFFNCEHQIWVITVRVIACLKHFKWERLHHSARLSLPKDLKLTCRNRSDFDAMRPALCLGQALELETPCVSGLGSPSHIH